ncbi:hypothetical protein EYF80_022358 [Liparis tanakae]|uniref:Uncharacterized protein n=1 Tax=Liparis tanakae TaxID=230148 RepID=A0A4Z2HQY4_9TELE|nr:hypothetical protein EYF80_022358 [Liparis tanakae]
MFHRPCHWYGFIDSQAKVFMPHLSGYQRHQHTNLEEDEDEEQLVDDGKKLKGLYPDEPDYGDRRKSN